MVAPALNAAAWDLMLSTAVLEYHGVLSDLEISPDLKIVQPVVVAKFSTDRTKFSTRVLNL